VLDSSDTVLANIEGSLPPAISANNLTRTISFAATIAKRCHQQMNA
jgi:hypothetical protein